MINQSQIQENIVEKTTAEDIHEVVENASGLDIQDKPKSTWLEYVSIMAMVFALLAIAGNFHAQSIFQMKTAEVQANSSAALTAILIKQRTLVAGAAAPAAPARVDIKAPENAPRLGSKDAKVEIIEYSDFQCPFCHKFFEEALPQIKKEYVDTGKASFVYQNFAFLGEESKQAARASLCANEQNKYWEYHDALFTNQAGENQGAYSDKKLIGLSEKAGVNTAQLKTCLESDKYARQIQEEQETARKFGVTGTPTVFINGHRLVGAQSFEAFKDKIEEAFGE